MAKSTKTVMFNQPNPPYMAGETATFVVVNADAYIQAGRAVEVKVNKGGKVSAPKNVSKNRQIDTGADAEKISAEPSKPANEGEEVAPEVPQKPVLKNRGSGKK